MASAAVAPTTWRWPASRRRRRSGRRRACVCFEPAWLSSELLREVVFERELHLETVAVEAVREVLAPPPLQLAAEHDVRRRIVQEVADKVVPTPVSIRRLRIAVVDVGHRVAERAAVLSRPAVIDERDDADERQRLA